MRELRGKQHLFKNLILCDIIVFIVTHFGQFSASLNKYIFNFILICYNVCVILFIYIGSTYIFLYITLQYFFIT